MQQPTPPQTAISGIWLQNNGAGKLERNYYYLDKLAVEFNKDLLTRYSDAFSTKLSLQTHIVSSHFFFFILVDIKYI